MTGVELVDVASTARSRAGRQRRRRRAPREAELDRRYPDRAKMRRATRPASGRRGTSSNGCGPARSSAPRPRPRAPARVGRRRVVVHRDIAPPCFATDAWVGGAILGDPAPGTGWTCRGTRCPTSRRPAGPGHAAVARRGPRTAARPDGDRPRVVDALTEAALAADTEPVEAPGWPRPRSYPVASACSSSSTRSGTTAASPSATSPPCRAGRTQAHDEGRDSQNCLKLAI